MGISNIDMLKIGRDFSRGVSEEIMKSQEKAKKKNRRLQQATRKLMEEKGIKYTTALRELEALPPEERFWEKS